MTVSVEFGISVGQWEYIHFTATAETGPDLLAKLEGQSDSLGEWLGDYHASLRAAILHGRGNAMKAVKVDADELIKSELGGKIIKTTDNEAQRELEAAIQDGTDKPEKPWERPVKATVDKPWAKPSIPAPQAVQSGLEDF